MESREAGVGVGGKLCLVQHCQYENDSVWRLV